MHHLEQMYFLLSVFADSESWVWAGKSLVRSTYETCYELPKSDEVFHRPLGGGRMKVGWYSVTPPENDSTGNSFPLHPTQVTLCFYSQTLGVASRALHVIYLMIHHQINHINLYVQLPKPKICDKLYQI